ncbi:hypothetical protein MPDQ_006283 [Monascus purpureus]|uniref:Alpha/beta hydrolase fold-3 domain-containing protein n=1 Tax=Monascus purpureus TaxID=5098 RepID=A0A507QYQ4_MONPU|nr:hypothetical protein MPDQ_006283 [Monascus purpureus]
MSFANVPILQRVRSGKIPSMLTYLRFKATATALRFLVSLRDTSSPANPDETIQIPSRDEGRTIKAHVYRPSATRSKPGPVLVNFHGSGFVIPMHGSDDEFARRVAQDAEYTVLDVSYRLAPEYPFPAAINDVEDVVNWVLSICGTDANSDSNHGLEFDRSRISISGFSAGANLALVASSQIFPKTTFRHVIAFYPPIDLAKDPYSKVAPDPNGRPIPAPVASFFDQCYLSSGVERKDPRVSPFYAAAESFLGSMLVVTCGRDSLCSEAEELVCKIKGVRGEDVVHWRAEGCNHGWDKRCQPGSEEEKAKEYAYRLAVEILNK